MTEQELRIVVAVMYFSTICFIIELAMTLTNMWRFLIKQSKYKTWPLLMFYILTICLAVVRIYFSFFYFVVVANNGIFGNLLHPVIKLNLGIVQCWILLELGLRVNLNIRLTENLQKSIIS